MVISDLFKFKYFCNLLSKHIFLRNIRFFEKIPNQIRKIMEDNYKLKISPKTRFLNFFRRIFKIKPLENMLSKKTQNLSTESLLVRLIPPNYLYSKNSQRDVERRGIRYSLDVSDYVEHGVFFGYKDTATEQLISLAKDKKMIFDVGVNIGLTLLNFAKVCPNGVIIGFEPDSKNFLKAKKNLKLNNFDNVTVINKGLGDKPAKMKLFRVNENNAGMNRVLSDSASKNNANLIFNEVEIITLDNFIQEKDIAQIDLIKIDVEGFELKVLNGAEQLMRKHLPILFIELDDENLKAQNDSAQSLILFLEQFGYKIWRADNKKAVKSEDDFSHCHFDIVCEKNLPGV